MAKGKVYIVGAGPGAAELITVKGLGILQAAEVVIYDYLVAPELLRNTKEYTELVCCEQLGKKRYISGADSAQDKINGLMVQRAKEGKKVVRLKGGDPSLFSRLSEELTALTKAGIEFEIIPGVAAGVAAACFTGIPLTDRKYSSSVVFVTGQEAAPKESTGRDWQSIARSGTIVLYMGVKRIGEIARRLIAAGLAKDTPVVAIAQVGNIRQKMKKATLLDIAQTVEKGRLTAPVVFIIGEVAAYEKRFNWFNRNKRILFTGLSAERFFLEGTYRHLPLIRIEPLADYTEFDSYVKNITAFDWLVFTSRYGVYYFFQRLHQVGFDARILKGIKIAAIGRSSAGELAKQGIRAELIPDEESSQGLVKDFKKIDLREKRIFVPRSDLSDKGLTESLRKQGAVVEAVVSYRNVLPEDLPDLDLGLFDEIMFTSPSTVRNFAKRYGAIPAAVKIRCMGKVTAAEARKWKYIV